MNPLEHLNPTGVVLIDSRRPGPLFISGLLVLHREPKEAEMSALAVCLA